MCCSILSRGHFRTRRTTSLFQCLSTASSQRADPEIHNSVFISQSTDPLFNLTFEDWLFRHSPPEKPLLFLYRNSPCVVIGRNQNPWKEVNMRALRSQGIPWVRRRSGGGTVYHDLGNTNFSIHLARRAFDRRVTSQIVLRAVLSLGIATARLNDRNDICVGEDKISRLFSSAYKIVNTRAYHHGTMLISTQLDTLGDLLRTDKETMVTAGVASVRSPVCNLQQFSGDIEHVAFARAVASEFRKEYDLDETTDPTQSIDETSGDLPYIDRGVTELKSWDWLYGQTPEFTYTLTKSFSWGPVTAELRAKHGIILSCALLAPDLPPDATRALGQLGTSAEGKIYGRWPPSERPHDGSAVCDVECWLADTLN
ncbi:Lipoyltransferase and lipoate-protein ligase [Mycena epipterygia]|nr:Lipoyltransferase and lipoate-protein ligase [Mycena epipterygia]